jgi:hypothetical protein
MDDFEILEHLILPFNLDVCNYVIHSFTTNRNCKKYILDGVETLIDTDNFEIKYARGQEFKIELYDDIVTGNILVIGTDSTGAVDSVPFFTITDVSETSTVNARFTYVSITQGSCTVKSFPANNVLSPGDFFDLALPLENTADTYDYSEHPFVIENKLDDPILNFNMRIISSDKDTNPTPDNVDLQIS